MGQGAGQKVNASLSPIKHSPPANTVGVVMLMSGDLKKFKFAFHSVLSFTDYPYMLTVVESMQTLTVRTYLRSIQKNHPINVLMHNDKLDGAAQLNLGLKYLFANASVKFGCVISDGVIVEPEWLSPLVARMMGEEATVNRLGLIHVVAPCRANGSTDMTFFRREVFEEVGSYSNSFSQLAVEAGFNTELAPGVMVHKMNGGQNG
jgi:hypothetical protein